MTKRPRTLLAVATVLGTTLSLGTATVVVAQPKPPKPDAPKKPDVPKPDDKAPKPDDKAPKNAPKPDDKAGTNESLQNGTGAVRPWAQGVSDADQRTALAMFQDGNKDLNDGVYVTAADKYRKALKVWDHPAINYNLALAQDSIGEPTDALASLDRAIELRPDHAIFRMHRAHLRVRLHDLTGAAEDLAEIEVSPRVTDTPSPRLAPPEEH